MAKSFVRYPIIGGDRNAWGPYVKSQLNLSLGLITSRLYLSGTSLYISAGNIGFDNGTYQGSIEITAAEIVPDSLAAASRWNFVTASVTGATPAFVAATIGSFSDENEPPPLSNYYNPIKGGYYLTPTLRILGVVWYNSSGDPERVLSCLSFQSFYGRGFKNTNGIYDKFNIAKFRRTGADVLLDTASPKHVPLDTESFNKINGCSLSSGGRIELPAGQYLIDAWFTAETDFVTQAYVDSRLYNFTAAATIESCHRLQLPGNTGVTVQAYGYVKKAYITLYAAAEIGLTAEDGGVVDCSIKGHGIYVEKIDGE